MCKNTYVWIILVCLFALPGCSGEWSRYPIEETTETEKEQYIAIGDSVTVTIFEEENLSGTYSVLADGAIHIPLINAVHIDGMIMDEAAKKIAAQLRSDGYLVNPKVTLSLSQSQSVLALGEVMKSGEFPYKDGMTVLDLIAKAGGFSYRANQDKFDIVRKNQHGKDTVIEAKISTRLQAGDLIRVRERYF